ncbi:jg28021, partial [Pararge aegeria aegeria]
PSGGEVNFTSVWCRVNRARVDRRIIATVWPFYLLRSHLPLDADVSITSRTPVEEEGISAQQKERLPPLIQTVTGRGATTHLIAPGTTATTHALTFQYSDIDCPVTLKAVPLHYGVTESSVFEKPTPVTNIEEIIEALKEWPNTSTFETSSLSVCSDSTTGSEGRFYREEAGKKLSSCSFIIMLP